MTPFGNDDFIDKRNRERIRELEARNRELESELRALSNSFGRSTSMTQNEKQLAILHAKRVLDA